MINNINMCLREIGHPGYEEDETWPNFDSDIYDTAANLIEHAQIGDPAWAAVKMVRYCGAPREWAEEIVARVRA